MLLSLQARIGTHGSDAALHHHELCSARAVSSTWTRKALRNTPVGTSSISRNSIVFKAHNFSISKLFLYAHMVILHTSSRHMIKHFSGVFNSLPLDLSTISLLSFHSSSVSTLHRPTS